MSLRTLSAAHLHDLDCEVLGSESKLRWDDRLGSLRKEKCVLHLQIDQRVDCGRQNFVMIPVLPLSGVETLYVPLPLSRERI